ncbi:hypothetical protein BDV38DRAFT_237295 [Aspergillus pseudotamarii]|uniref:Uncharacterized protein n=1 Tax=Aspergillus pseudotamarii TaxID=132259 RepID=A0A5N6T5R5_ASPPS|nr:uncharacterized protein BDV38DRAFT_237295 [Aspergillus pseudotamarii]KAE8141664.1 hypothetical protein BDV38DRAFT_237295 [Aspergillus pseudotamarii]
MNTSRDIIHIKLVSSYNSITSHHLLGRVPILPPVTFRLQQQAEVYSNRNSKKLQELQLWHHNPGIPSRMVSYGIYPQHRYIRAF